MHELEVPLALTRFQIDADEALTEQVVARAVAAIEVRRRRLDRQVHEARLLIDGNLRPHPGVPVDRPRLVLPRVVAELAGSWNGVELPQLFAGSVVVGADGR